MFFLQLNPVGHRVVVFRYWRNIAFSSFGGFWLWMLISSFNF